MLNSDKNNYLNLEVNQDKLTKLNKLCQEKGLDYNQVINSLIDQYLNDNINSLHHFEADFKSIILKEIAPLLERINNLEKFINNNQGIIEKDQHQSKSENNQKDRRYLPRHEVWQLLKKTDFIHHSGYDHFLNATPNEFESYGIFFDTIKKRYYIFLS